MADDNTNPTLTNPEHTQQPPAATGGAPDKVFTQAELDAIIKDRLDRQQRALTAQQEKDRAAAEAAKLAEQGEYKKLAETAQQERDTLRAQLADVQHGVLQREVAAEHKLPADLATRLRGTTREELAADAQALAKLVAQPAPPAPPGNRPNPKPTTGPDARPDTETEMRNSGRYNAV